MSIQNQGYEFSAEPKVVKGRQKYRNEEMLANKKYVNLMFEPRVVRGNTYSSTNFNPEELSTQPKTFKPIRKNVSSSEVQNENDQEMVQENVGELPVELRDRWNVEIQVDPYVETITNKPPCYEQQSQTEFVLEKEVKTFSLHLKTGQDVETQIWDGELFDFDYECEPLLSVIIGKTLVQARMEVLEEEELRVMRNEQIRFKSLKAEQEAKMRMMEQKEIRIEEENVDL